MSGESDAGYVPDTPSFAIFFLLKAGEPANWFRAWSGFGAFDLPHDLFDTTGGRYVGLGFPTALPLLSQAINGGFSGLDFTLSGVDVETLRLIGVDREAVDGSEVHVGLVDLNEFQQPTGPCDWLMTAIAGKPRVSRQGAGDGAMRSITLPTVTGMRARNRATFTYYSPISQRARSPGDAFFDLTPNYNAGTTVTWPK